MVALPRAVDESALRHAQVAAARRIWVIGLREPAAQASGALQGDPSLEVVSTAAFGSVTLRLLQRE
jgi:hypothetical protein